MFHTPAHKAALSRRPVETLDDEIRRMQAAEAEQLSLRRNEGQTLFVSDPTPGDDFTVVALVSKHGQVVDFEVLK